MGFAKFFVMILFMFSCVREMGPEERVRTFYKELLSSSEPESLEEHLAVNNSFEEIELPLENHILVGLKVISSKKMSETQHFITIDLQYKQNKDIVDVRKVVEVVRIDSSGNDWKIKSIENIKTYVELQKSIEIKK